MSGVNHRMENYTALKPVRLEDFKCTSSQAVPTPVQLVKHFSQLGQQRLNYAGISLSATVNFSTPLSKLSEDSSPLFQIPDWQLSSESSEDGESAFPWLPSHPQAVLQIPDGSQAFEVDPSDEESVAPTSPTPSDETAESNNTDVGTPDKNGKRQYTCPVCAKTYRMRSSLEKHLKVPCEIRPYKCPICKKAFKRPDHLKAHSRMHTGERPYLCSLCGKTFRQKNHLQRHADRKHVNGKVVDDGEDIDQDQSSSFDVCGLEDLEDDEMRAEDQD